MVMEFNNKQYIPSKGQEKISSQEFSSQKQRIKNIENNVEELKKEDKDIKDIIITLKETVDILTGSVNILKWVFGIGLPILSGLLTVIVGLLITVL
ncbi:hypothetical protein [Methanobrevibacter arboriphilus]|uniref:Uncharacterized protein n=1 Tax=Methanobrevibacter arboriphilus TaxID=39441 RepID=A0ACA8R5X1_METAZ|nr:hypothetical protein [Methanobrevibacter arboriphilus]BBL62198.1 hypothetical protein MarbSA_12380 [Methanobrevibacter arboriphilus]